MLLKDLLLSTEIVDSIGNLETNITGIAIDSRRVRPGFLFVAVKGTQTDGHAFVDKAIENGAAALVVCEPVNAPKASAVVRVSDTEKLVGPIATRFYGDPSHKLRLVGVTGTNGRTTVATVLYQLYRGLGYKVGLVSTVCNYIDDRTVEATHTTPDPIELNALLAEMVTNTASAVCISKGLSSPTSRATTSTITALSRTTATPKRCSSTI